jgi:UDP-N-acetylglucosamine 2-epimerase (non-hydrolysing)
MNQASIAARTAERIHFVGNVMVDTLLRELPQARALGVAARLGLEPGGYVPVTLHRPSNLDDPARLTALLAALSEIGRSHPVVFPAHPRTQSRLRDLQVEPTNGVRVIEPLSYLEMISLVADAWGVLTDSGGLQEETTVLGVPCLTVRPNTERPVTITQGTNRLAPADPRDIPSLVAEWFGARQKGRTPELWDGRAAERIATVIGGSLA